MAVPRRGWQTPVRVCKNCFDAGQQQQENSANGNSTKNADDIRARKVGEALISTINSAASILDYPKGEKAVSTLTNHRLILTLPLSLRLDFIKDSARPSYWVSDAESPNCSICSLVFGTDEETMNADRNGNCQFPIADPVDTRRHHCRACGLSVCNSCSRGRRPVPERNWLADVRVCDACINLAG